MGRPVMVFVLAFMLTMSAPSSQVSAQRDCSRESVGLIPIIDLGDERYQGETGGLYPDGTSQVPPEHLRIGLDRAAGVEPLDERGRPASDGSIVMISVGVSNTLGEFKAFAGLAAELPSLNEQLVLVNGAQVGQSINRWVGSRSERTWGKVVENLFEAGVTPAQVQVAWIKLPPSDRGAPTLDDARDHAAALGLVITQLQDRYPNIELAYFSSRIYGGYIADEDSEPNAYHDGFAVKWAVEAQIAGQSRPNSDPSVGSVEAPWSAWGPYLWADGVIPRSDGLTWECEHFQDDGVHPSVLGAEQVGRLLIDHFSQHPTSRDWFLEPDTVSAPTTAEIAAPTGSTITTLTSLSTEATAATSASTLDHRPTSGESSPTIQGWIWLVAGVVGGSLLTMAWSSGRRRYSDAPPAE